MVFFAHKAVRRAATKWERKMTTL